MILLQPFLVFALLHCVALSLLSPHCLSFDRSLEDVVLMHYLSLYYRHRQQFIVGVTMNG